MGESQQDWIEAELMNKKEAIAELREKLEKEKEVNEHLKQTANAEV